MEITIGTHHTYRVDVTIDGRRQIVYVPATSHFAARLAILWRGDVIDVHTITLLSDRIDDWASAS